MSIELKPLEVVPTPGKPAGIDPALITLLQSTASQAAAQAVESANALAMKLAHENMLAMERRLAAIEAPPRMIARIEFNQVTTDLNTGDEISEQSAAIIARCLRLVQLNEHPLLVGPAGCGKSTLARMVADILKRPFSSASWTAGTNETSCLYGRQHATGFNEAGFSKAFRHGGINLQDEIDRADPNGLCKLNAALANGHFYNEVLGEMLTRHTDFGCIGTANTCGRGSDGVYVGANQLDASSVDRFVPIAVDYDPVYEKRVCPDAEIYGMLTQARAELRRLKAVEIISTRTLKKVYGEHKAGTALVDCIASATMGWPTDIIKQVKLDADRVVSRVRTKKPAKQDAVTPEAVTANLAEIQISENEARIAELTRKLAGG